MKSIHTKLDNARRAYKLYSHGKWILWGLIEALIALSVAYVFSFINQDGLITWIRLEVLGITLILFVIFTVFSSIRCLITKNAWQKLKIKELEDKN